jgi:hypothetical protein
VDQPSWQQWGGRPGWFAAAGLLQQCHPGSGVRPGIHPSLCLLCNRRMVAVWMVPLLRGRLQLLQKLQHGTPVVIRQGALASRDLLACMFALLLSPPVLLSVGVQTQQRAAAGGRRQGSAAAALW